MKFIKFALKKKRGFLIASLILLCISLIVVSVTYNYLNTPIGTIFFTIGTTISSGMIVTLFDLARNISEELSNEIITNITNSGIDKIYAHRDVEEYYDLVKKAKEIDIVGYSLRGFMQSHKETILKLAQNNRFRMRIVIVDPNSEISKNREILENGRYNQEFLNNFEIICNDFKSFKNIEIYTVDHALGSMIFRIDDLMYVGPHFMKSASKSTFTIRLKSNTELYKTFEEEFKYMYEHSKKIN